VALIWSLVLLFLIGWIDYVTGVEISLAAFYWIPVAMATWYCGTRAGYWLAAVSAACAVGTDIAGGLVHSRPFFLFWDVAMRFFSLAIFAWMLAKIKQLYEEAQKATQLQIELESSRAAYRELQALSHIIAHNLHAPLRGIAGYSHIVLQSYAGQLDAQGQEYLRRLQQSSQTMAGLINALLDLIEFSGGELRREPVDLSGVAESIAAELKQKAPDRAVEFTLEPGITVLGDHRLLRMALQCLLDNAWKFTANCPTPTIAFGLMRQQGRQVYFVRDNGAGFNMAYADKLFMPFQSVHKKGEFEGLGIGLPIAERIIRRHGGRIWAEGTEGKGAAFYFTLEKEESAAAFSFSTAC
jgi:light-regulated signal transduction histidine kinase (bacteriophytochrome)